ncbi:MAG TPA: hypothetical protein VK172_08115 [Lentimicrobium sp.]|nr:hypothetical protein [Lentimicrobium sp.]
MNKLITIFLVFTTNLLCGQSFLDKELKFVGNVKAVYYLEFKVIEKDDKILKGDTIECSYLKYEFDNKNRLLSEEYCLLDLFTSYKYKYDRNGRLIDRTNFNHLDRKYVYDSTGNQVKELMYDSEGLMGYWSYKYDNNGNKIERTGYLGDDFVERWKYEYDQDYKKIIEFMVGAEPYNNPSDMVKTYEYDNDGRLISSVWTDPKTKTTSVDKYKYNVKGDIIEHYNKNDFQRGIEELKTFNYQYDQNGNWIQRIEYINARPITITERKIEYN